MAPGNSIRELTEKYEELLRKAHRARGGGTATGESLQYETEARELLSATARGTR
jgi:hypothetical protein